MLEKECKDSCNFDEDEQFFFNNLEEIKRKYGEETYVAICNGKIVDCDGYKMNLYERTLITYGSSRLLIERVKDYKKSHLESLEGAD